MTFFLPRPRYPMSLYMFSTSCFTILSANLLSIGWCCRSCIDNPFSFSSFFLFLVHLNSGLGQLAKRGEAPNVMGWASGWWQSSVTDTLLFSIHVFNHLSHFLNGVLVQRRGDMSLANTMSKPSNGGIHFLLCQKSAQCLCMYTFEDYGKIGAASEMEWGYVWVNK